MTQEEVEAIELVMDNVNRLIDDSTLLIRHGGLASAFVLDVIALEEVGKVIHMRWQYLGHKTTRQGRTGHLQKQWAVACVLIAHKLLPLLKILSLGHATEQQAKMEELALSFMGSDERRFFERVIAKNLDRAKQLGLYEDESNAQAGITRDAIDYVAIKEISDTILQAVPLLTDDIVLTVANVFYEIMPPLQDAILEDVNKY